MIVFGATGRIGKHAGRRALDEGHQVTAFRRSAESIDVGESGLQTFRGDVLDAGTVAQAVDGHDAVIVCLGSNNLRDKTTLSVGTQNIVDGMVDHNVDRLVITSAAGVDESWAQISWIPRLLFKTMLRNAFADHHAQEALVKQSPLHWTIVRSAVLTDKPATGNYTVSNTAAAKRISREDLADFLAKQVVDPTYTRQAISVTS